MRCSVPAIVATFITAVSAVPTNVDDGVKISVIPKDTKLIRSDPASIIKRTTRNLTGENCVTRCAYQLPGLPLTGPNENDCLVVIQNLWNNGYNLFTVPPYASYTQAYRSCLVLFENTTPDTLQYTYHYLGTVADYLRQACNAAHSASEGDCWFENIGYDGLNMPYIAVKHT